MTCHKAGKLLVEHDHQTGIIRGLVCNQCNVLLAKRPVPSFLHWYVKNPPLVKFKIPYERTAMLLLVLKLLGYTT